MAKLLLEEVEIRSELVERGNITNLIKDKYCSFIENLTNSSLSNKLCMWINKYIYVYLLYSTTALSRVLPVV